MKFSMVLIDEQFRTWHMDPKLNSDPRWKAKQVNEMYDSLDQWRQAFLLSVGGRVHHETNGDHKGSRVWQDSIVGRKNWMLNRFSFRKHIFVFLVVYICAIYSMYFSLREKFQLIFSLDESELTEVARLELTCLCVLPQRVAQFILCESWNWSRVAHAIAY